MFASGEAQPRDDICHDRVEVVARRADREPQPSRVTQGSTQWQFEMDDVVLWHVAHTLVAQRCGGPVDTVDLDGACRREADAEHGLEQCRLSGSTPSDDGDHLTDSDVDVDALKAAASSDVLLEPTST